MQMQVRMDIHTNRQRQNAGHPLSHTIGLQNLSCIEQLVVIDVLAI